MLNLKVKCSICGKEESNPDVIKEASEAIKKYGLKAEHYLYFLNVMSGKCLNSDEHSFLFDEEFMASANNIITKYKANLAEIETLKNTQRDLIKEILELDIKIKEVRSKEESTNHRLQNIYENTPTLNKEVENSTGYGNIEIWYWGIYENYKTEKC